MKKCLIVCAGDFDEISFLSEKDPECFVIAADAGYAYLQKLGVKPDLVIGDFDSLGRVPENSLVLPVEKDLTDSFAAANEGLKRGYTEFTLYGALGGKRFSHSLANLQLLAYLNEKGADARIADKNSRVRLLTRGSYSYTSEQTGDISFVAYSETAALSLSGFKYNAENTELSNKSSLCVSNSFTGTEAKLTVHGGEVLEIRENFA